MKDPLKNLNITELADMEENEGLAIMCLSKDRRCSQSCSSSPTTEANEESSQLDERDVKPIAKDYPKKNGEILSGQYGINLLLLGIAFMLAVSHHGPSVKEKHLLAYITTAMIIQLLWMLWYVIRRNRQTNSAPDKDPSAGTRWLRGGLTILALLSLIMDAFRITVYSGYRKCLSPTQVVYPIVHMLHTVSQVYFLWFHIKDMIKTCLTFERFGVIHAVFTNLLIWCNGAMSESLHFLEEHQERLAELGFINHTKGYDKPLCKCTISACSKFSKSLYYLYPFNIEYHIIVSAMMFVMWKNIGRTIEPNHHHHHKGKNPSRSKQLVFGPFLGLVALAGTITMMVLYLIQVEDTLETHLAAISMFYYHGIVMLACMATAGTLGLVIYRMDHRPWDASKNPARQLDAELLCGASVGTWLMSWCSVVAVVAASRSPRYRWAILAYSLLLVLEKYIQNLFIVESLYRQHEAVAVVAEEKDEDKAQEDASRIFSVSSQVPTSSSTAVVHQQNDYISLDGAPAGNSLVLASQISPSREHLPSHAVPSMTTQDRKKLILRNIAIFLFLCNSALWLLPAFGCRPQYDNGLEQETFGYTIWTMVLNFAMPLNLFYRMHCVAALFEVFQHLS